MQNKKPDLSNMPRYLYKFRSMSEESFKFTKQVVEKSELFFACPLELNDPFEGYFAFDQDDFLSSMPEIKKKIIATARTSQYEAELDAALPSLIDSFRLNTRETFLRNVGIVSMTARYDSALMWAHYADAHQGLCFEFDLSIAADWGITLLPVVYDDRCKVGKISDFDELSRTMTSSLYHKSSDWEYEKEWRFIQLSGSGPVQFPEEMLSGVIFGSQSDTEKSQKIYDLIKQKSGTTRIGKAGRDPFSYQTRVVQVGDSQQGIFESQDEVCLWSEGGRG